jgi:ribose transport system substrate-binding protein
MKLSVIVAGGVAVALAVAGCGGSNNESAAQPGGGGTTGAAPVPGAAPSPDPDAEAYARVLASSDVQVDTAKWKKNGPYHIAAVTQGPVNGWGTLFDAQLKSAAAKDTAEVSGLDLYPSMANAEKQTQDLELLINKKPDAIILTPMSVAALSAPITRAMAAGIPVINCGARSNGAGWVTEVGQPLYPMGFSAAVHLAKMLNGKGKIIMLNGIPGVDAGEIWKAGGHDALKSYPGIQVAGEGAGNWSTADSKKLASSLLAANPKIDGVLSMGMEMGIGVVQAFLDAGKPVPPIAGTGAMNGFNKLAIDNHVKWWAVSYNPSLSKVCLDTALSVLKGRPVKKYIDGTKQMTGTLEFSDANEKETYKPALSDQLPLGPTFMSDAELAGAGFGK